MKSIELKELVRSTIRERFMNEMSQNDIHFKAVMKFYDGGSPSAKKAISLYTCGKPNANRNQIVKELMDMNYHEIQDVQKHFKIREYVDTRGAERVAVALPQTEENPVNESFVKGVTYGGTVCKGGCYMGKEGLNKLIKISKESPKDVFMFRDDNYSGLQPHFIKNGVIAKAHTVNYAYDLEKYKVRNLNIDKNVILSFKLFETTN